MRNEVPKPGLAFSGRLKCITPIDRKWSFVCLEDVAIRQRGLIGAL
jgi:hypothetical protein